MTTWAMAVASIALSVAAQFALKWGMSGVAAARAGLPPTDPSILPGLLQTLALHARPGIVLGFVLYGLGAVVWLSVLGRWEVSRAYPLVGLGFVATLVVGWAMGEAVGPQRVIGVLLIAAGVALVGRS